MFGIFANVWEIFRTEIHASPSMVDRIVMAAVCLHNFRIIENENIEEFIEPNVPHRQNENLQPFDEPIFGDSRGDCEEMRNQLAEYFVNGGSVPWQDQLIN